MKIDAAFAESYPGLFDGLVKLCALVDIEFANKTKIEKKKAKNLYAFFLENTLVLHKKEFDCRELFFSATNANKIEFTLRVNFWTNIRFSINVKKGFVLTI